MKIGGHSACGTHGGSNQDAWAADTGRGWAIVADGVGGRPGGQVASAVAVDVMAAVLKAGEDRAVGRDEVIRLAARAPEILREGMERAGAAVRELKTTDRLPPATTLAAVWVLGTTAYVIHVGDTRVYRVGADGEVHQVTRDQADPGVPGDPARPLTGCLGHAGSVAPEAARLALGAGDQLLLATDGVHGAADDAAIARLMVGARRGPGHVAAALVGAARKAGSIDDATAVVLAQLPVAADASGALTVERRSVRFARIACSALVAALVIGSVLASQRNARRAWVGSDPSGAAVVVERGLWLPVGRRMVEWLPTLPRPGAPLEVIPMARARSLGEARERAVALAFARLPSVGQSPFSLERRAIRLRQLVRVAPLPDVRQALVEVEILLADHAEGVGEWEAALGYLEEARKAGASGASLSGRQRRVAERLAERYLERARLSAAAREIDDARSWLRKARRLAVAGLAAAPDAAAAPRRQEGDHP